MPASRTSARPSRIEAQREQGQGSASQQRPRCLNRGDEYLMELVPGYKPKADEEFKEFLRGLGGDKATDDNMHEYIEGFNAAAKPQPDDRNVYIVSIPNSDLVIRIWDGGMSGYRAFCLDFFDTRRRTPVNLPPGFSLWPSVANAPSVFTMGGRLSSWENAFGKRGRQIPLGTEKWSVPEGSYITLKRRNHPEFTFAIPVRQTQYHEAIVQPVLGADY
ncbi:uncharacterized protein B0H18DRAFT_1088856 [Fomitopsis serialis]|uniref:uncharacterized protein n=1 Tax=Fomitopsis serialis TaxID=139415 RepID=UPI0020080A64|nr:uncharacterized protein B0H18DRAFT_1088856 [Neoantrodia serialis]KAH9911836.1 hypothetical protein B0H18DRAFT_1088856 [Neoantrodia serialis]